ncbi:MAG: glycosyltransferase family 4 protein [Gluconacetobacter diazotrophicus]|nr:glycosyltransferase family 4 protein [Gluconacetobacter diazotrophicus]
MLHRAWQRLPPRARRRWLVRATALAAPRPDRVPPETSGGLVVGGEIGRPSGLGEAARIMAAAAGRLGVERCEVAAGPGKRVRDDADWPERAAILLHVNAPQIPATLMGFGAKRLRGRRVIGQWAWELPVLPAEWRHAVPFVHEVWAPSRFTARAIEAIMPGKVRVVPHPVALAPPVPAAMGRDAFGLPADAFVVLCSFSLASSFARKNPLAAIAAFRDAFGERMDRLLLLKVGNAEHWDADLAVLRDAVAGAPNIRLMTAMLAEGEMHALTRNCDAVLSLHRSEGFGLVPAQAMLLERAVVATDWSATAEFLHPGCGMPVRYRLVPARDPRGVFEAPGAVWADAEVGDAARALRWLAEDGERPVRLGRAAAAEGRARFGGAELRDALAAAGIGMAVEA